MTGVRSSGDDRTPLRVVFVGVVLGLILVLEPHQGLASHISEQQAIEAFQALEGRIDNLEVENSDQQAQIDALIELANSLLPAPLTVFVSSGSYAPGIDFSSLEDADGICQQLATDAGLSGAYKAWLSNELASPSSRFNRSSARYVLTDGTLVAQDWSDLTDCTNPNCLRHPIDLDDTQTAATSDYVWTGTTATGVVDLAEGDCLAWSSTVLGGGAGRVDSIGGSWTSILYGRFCGLSLLLYCFEQ